MGGCSTPSEAPRAPSREQAIATYELYFDNVIDLSTQGTILREAAVFCTIVADPTLTPVRLPPILYANLAIALSIAFLGGVGSSTPRCGFKLHEN